ncbi:hypothetical protein AGLY_016465 [Aphis glycines]|uniref:Uncharacterized protein n=1 Tax=Aphis glycines TaxID=307491 RepID=A0A6G0SZP2_APHGL|nr:hypothetical protein AGLY_016465 [Aphis glycines]
MQYKCNNSLSKIHRIGIVVVYQANRRTRVHKQGFSERWILRGKYFCRNKTLRNNPTVFVFLQTNHSILHHSIACTWQVTNFAQIHGGTFGNESLLKKTTYRTSTSATPKEKELTSNTTAQQSRRMKASTQTIVVIILRGRSGTRNSTVKHAYSPRRTSQDYFGEKIMFLRLTRAEENGKHESIRHVLLCLVYLAAAFENNVHITTPRTITAIPHYRNYKAKFCVYYFNIFYQEKQLIEKYARLRT